MNQMIKGNYPYKIVERKIDIIGRFQIVRDTIQIDGINYPFSYEMSDDAVVVLPLIKEDVVLIRQYRHSLDEWVWELPSGGLSGSNPYDAAKRELLEESGYVSNSFYELGEYYVSEGTMNSKSHFFVAYCESYVGQKCEPTELIEVHRVTQGKMESMVRNHEITTSCTVLAWELFKNKRGLGC